MYQKYFASFFVKWELVYSTQDVAEYSTIRGKLDNKDVKYKTKTISTGGGEGGGYGFASTYQLFVPKEVVHEASKAIHHST